MSSFPGIAPRERVGVGGSADMRAPWYGPSLESVLVPHPPSDPGEAFAAVQNADGLLDLLRQGFGDSADLHYRWHPDD